MRKLTTQIGDDIQEQKPRSRVPMITMIGVLLAGFAPLALESGAICLASWKEFMGTSADVKTPYLDSLTEHIETAQYALHDQVTPWFHRVPWDPRMVLPTAALVMAVAMLMLRR